MSDSLRRHGLQPARLLSPWDIFWQEHWSGLPFPSPGDLPDLCLWHCIYCWATREAPFLHQFSHFSSPSRSSEDHGLSFGMHSWNKHTQGQRIPILVPFFFFFFATLSYWWAFRWLSGKESICNSGDTGDLGSVSASGRYSGEGNSNPLQYSCMENPTNRGAKSWT